MVSLRVVERLRGTKQLIQLLLVHATARGVSCGGYSKSPTQTTYSSTPSLGAP